METVRLICLLFSIFETFGQLNSKENDTLQAKNVFAGTTSGKVSNVLRDILNQESLVRFSMDENERLRHELKTLSDHYNHSIESLQTLHEKELLFLRNQTSRLQKENEGISLDTTEIKKQLGEFNKTFNDIEFMKKRLTDVTEEQHTLDVKNRQMEDENERLRHELKTLSDHYNHSIESLQTLHEKELLFLRNQTSSLQKKNDGITLDAIEIKIQLGKFNKTFDYLNMTKEEEKKEFQQNIQSLKMEVKENKNSYEAQKIGLGVVKTLFTEHIKNFNESRTAFQQELKILNKRMEATEKQDNLSSRVQFVENSLRRFSLSLDDLRAAQNVSNTQLMRILTHLLHVTGSSKDCKKLYESGTRTSAVYDIYPWDSYDSKKNLVGVQVQCDMSTAGGGWTVIQSRVDGKVNFSRSWEDYKVGFGDPSTSYWIGNDIIHEMTKDNRSSLYVSITAKNGTTFSIQYDTFSISGEEDDYRLYIAGNATGRLDDRIRYGTGVNNINGMKFSTYDKDNDPASDPCPGWAGIGGWWFNSCHDAYLNGQYPSGEWEQPWQGTFIDGSEISTTRMMIKRK
ncbi:fibroleukin-like [Saccostrea cucullata]|uniref:fibroleukin-like n=1 Tax=Saccostrea cuccullata TaxID=36930 RepID=UPI002ED011A6